MKRSISLFIAIVLILITYGSAMAQFPFSLHPINPFLSPFPFFLERPLVSTYNWLPPLSFVGPFITPPLLPRASLPIVSPLMMPQPLIRNAAATLTIYFNPSVSIIQVTVLPVSPVAAPVTAVAPAVTTPSLGLTALFLLPLLTGATGPTQTKTLTRLTTTTPTLPTLTGLLPLI